MNTLTITLSQLCKILRTASDWHKINNGHDDRVSAMSMEIGKRINLPEEQIELLGYAAELHDIGRVGMDNAIMNKRGKLTDSEYGAIKSHSEIGFKIIRDILPPSISLGVLHHHERYDGFGYPRMLSGENIPLFARIIRIADVYDALTHDRPYRLALSNEDALHIMELEKNTFDPKIYAIFLEIIKEVK